MQRILGIICLLFIINSNSAQAQNFYSWQEFGVSAGGSQYFGDLNDNYGFKYIRPAGGAFARFHLNPYIAVKGTVNYTHVGYDDKYSSDLYNQQRNLSFQSNILEAAVQAEFNFFRFSTGELGSRFTPYLTGGIGAFYYNPYAILNGRRYDLRPLGTEGQFAGYSERKYSSFSVCFPIGAGFKYWVRPGLNLGFEVADRLTMTDYLDDVSTTYVGADKFPTDPQSPNPAYILQDRSIEKTPTTPLGRDGKQRGNSASKDQYLMFMFNISIQLKTYKCPSFIRNNWNEF